MNKKTIIPQLSSFLKEEEFSVSSSDSKRSCFDLIAKRDALVLLIKYLLNIDSINEELAWDLKNISKIFNACPLLIGERTRQFDLQDGVLHSRYGINAVSPRTFMDIFTQNIYPVVNSSRGGYYVKIDGEKLKKIRTEQNISVGHLSEEIGVSRTMIYSYENNGFGATFAKVLLLEEFFNESLAIPLQIFSHPPTCGHDNMIPLSDFVSTIFGGLEQMGFDIHPLRRAPFDAVTQTDDEFLVTKFDKKPKSILNKIRVIKEFSDTTNCLAFVLTSNSGSGENFEGVPVIKTSEIDKMESRDEFLETLELRR